MLVTLKDFNMKSMLQKATDELASLPNQACEPKMSRNRYKSKEKINNAEFELEDTPLRTIKKRRGSN